MKTHHQLSFVQLTSSGLLLTLLISLPAAWSSAQEDVGGQAKSILAKYCGECHSAPSNEGGIDYITSLSKLVDRKKVISNSLEQSRVWVRMQDKEDPMPPEYAENGAPTAEENEVIRKWISGGASKDFVPSPQIVKPRAIVRTSDVVRAVYEHLDGMDMQDRAYQRYFTLNHLHNLSRERVSDQKLALVRAAVSKVINSLSWRAEIVIPQPIDSQQTVLAIDLRDLDWDANPSGGRPDLWNLIAAHYPYGLSHDRYPDAMATNDRADSIYDSTQIDLPWMRADWFVAHATQPRIYHTVLYDAVFPELRQRARIEVEHPDGVRRSEPAMTASDLEEWLHVDLERNIRRGRAVRAGFTKSGVSSQERLIERHPAIYGSYWISYDFKKGNPQSNLLQRPLGPENAFVERGIKRFAFKHDGGEVIFNLPNGLQAYLLMDGEGKRITFGPPDVVEDRAKTLGNGVIVNGLSCMACHKQGLQREFEDDVRFGIAGFSTDAKRLVRRLYLDRPELDVLMDRDDARFQQGARDAMAPFLADYPDLLTDEALIEPVGSVARDFLVTVLDLELIAAEVGVDQELLKNAIQFNPELRVGGLPAVANGRAIKRDAWELGQAASLFQVVAEALKQGHRAKILAEL